MSVLTIIEFPDPRLRTKAEPVSVFDAELKQFVADMFETMYDANGVGLAATQVNVHKQVLVADMSDERNQPLALINPRLLTKDGAQVYQEGCLSFPGIYVPVKRGMRAKIRAMDLDGNIFEDEGEELYARAMQHETDHLNGRLLIDQVGPVKRELIKRRLRKEAEAEREEAAERAGNRSSSAG